LTTLLDAIGAPRPDADEATKSVLDAVAGFGRLQSYLDDPTFTIGI
jgi:hypothetical protein